MVRCKCEPRTLRREAARLPFQPHTFHTVLYTNPARILYKKPHWARKPRGPTVPLLLIAAIARSRGPRKTKGSWEKCDRSIDSKHHGAFVSAPTLSGRVAVLFEREEQWHFNASNRACGLGLLFIGGLPR